MKSNVIFKINHHVALLLFAIISLSFSTPTSADELALLINADGKLTGARNIAVDGKLYDVEFLDGTYTDIFGIEGQAFTNEDDAKEASQSLIDSVFIPEADGNFDADTTLINGCTNANSCSIFTPHTVLIGKGAVVMGALAVNVSEANASKVEYAADSTNSHNSELNYDFHESDNMVYARWHIVTPVSAVAKPSTYAMVKPYTYITLGIGLLGIAGLLISRRQV